MSLETFFEQFNHLADAPNGVQKLRELILQLAVQGKLVPQNPNDEPASLLLKRIRVEREHLVKAKKINKVRAVSSIADDEVPYELPKNWEWVRLAEVGYDWGQKKPDEVFTYIDVSSINKEQGVILDNTNILQPDKAPSRARKLVCKGTVIYATVRPYLLNIAIVDRQFEPEPIVSTAFAVIHPFCGILNKYLYYYLRSKPFVQYVGVQMKGMAYPAINDGQLYEGLIPIPPSNEQKRIVAKVEQLMRLCDELEEGQKQRRSHLIQLNQGTIAQLLTATPDEFGDRWQRICHNFDLLYNLPENITQLRQAILQLAVQGKLIPQDPDDEPASVLFERVETARDLFQQEGSLKKSSPLSQIASHEEPYEIPANWIWLRVGDFYKVVGGVQKTPKRKPVSHYFPYLRVANVYRGKLDLTEIAYFELFEGELERWQLKAGDLLVVEGNGSETEIGRCAIWSEEIKDCVHQNHIIRCRSIGHDGGPFTLLFLNSPAGMAEMKKLAITTSGLYSLSVGKIRGIIVPLPPLQEQQRILRKVEQLMILCDELEAKLKQTQSDSEKLMEVAVRQVLAA